MKTSGIGITGLGVHLPKDTRTNDWWSDDVVATWTKTADGRQDRPAERPDEIQTEGGRIMLEHMGRYRDDPFRGARERRIMSADTKPTDMELAAAKEAIEDAGVEPGAIDLVITTTTTPDFLHVPNSCAVHHALGLAPHAMTLDAGTMCNGFMHSLSIAERMIASGAANHALLVQSCAMTPFMNPRLPMSAWFGDAASAMVLGRVPGERGVLSMAHHTDGSTFGSIVTGIPGKDWYAGGQLTGYLHDEGRVRRMISDLLHDSRPLLGRSAEDANVKLTDVDFYACHQGFAWLRAATQEHAGLDNARWLDTFPWAASVVGVNVPLVLYSARAEGMLSDGDLVAFFSGGVGATLSAAMVRWGRG